MTPGFYKNQEGMILYAQHIVEGNGYVLLIQDKDSYVYPVDGWIYAEDIDTAEAYFASEIV